MQENPAQGETIMSEILGPDGMAASKEQTILKLHEVEVPFPTNDPKHLAAQCIRQVQTPAGPMGTFTMTPDTAFVFLETVLAFESRDEGYRKLVEHMEQQEERIKKLNDDLGVLEGRLQRLENPRPVGS